MCVSRGRGKLMGGDPSLVFTDLGGSLGPQFLKNSVQNFLNY